MPHLRSISLSRSRLGVTSKGGHGGRSNDGRFTWLGLALCFALALVTLVAGVSHLGFAVAQSTATPSAAATAPTGALRASLNDLPAAPITVRLLRITLAPGASVPAHTHPGVETAIVESGTLTVLTAGEIIVNAAEASATPAPNETFELGPGDHLVYLPGSEMTFGNAGEEPVTLLASVVLPIGHQHPPGITYTQGRPAEDAFDGVTSQILGDGFAENVPGAPYTLTIDELTLAAGEPLPASGVLTLLSVAGEGDELRITALEGSVQLTETANPGLQPDATRGASFTLRQGDAAFFPGGLTETARPASAGALTLLRLRIEGGSAGATPEPPVPAVVEVSGPPVATPVPTPGGGPVGISTVPSGGTFVAGASVVVSDDGVNLRADPSTSGVIVTVLAAGQTLTVAGAPVEADGLTWVPVTDPADAAVIGWVSADFLVLETA
jgi:quercetin dioxygenase-like cupin family protein